MSSRPCVALQEPLSFTTMVVPDFRPPANDDLGESA